jgi:cyclitol oxidoreductase
MQPTSRPELKGHRVLITGGSSGIGRAIADVLIRAHAEVAIISRRLPTAWEGGPPPGWDSGRNLIRGDFTDPQTVIESVEHWVELEKGKIDTLIHCAVSYGFGSRHTFLETTGEEWNEIMSVSLNTPFLLTRALLPFLLKQSEGLVMYISSEVAFNSGPKRVGYSTSKAAAHTMFKGLAEELYETNVRIVGLVPEGMVDTPGIRRRRSPNFDFSTYAPANSFERSALAFVETLGAGHHNEMFVVQADGQYYAMGNRQIASQSK